MDSFVCCRRSVWKRFIVESVWSRQKNVEVAAWRYLNSLLSVVDFSRTGQ